MNILINIINALFLPIRIVMPHEWVNKMGLRSMRDERINTVRKYCKGRLLDIGCGNNELVKGYGNCSVLEVML